MTKRTENIIMFVLAGSLLFSSIGAGLLLLTQDDDSEQNVVDDITVNQSTDNNTNDNSATDNSQATPDVPEAFIPDADVTELQAVDLTEGDGQAVQASDTLTVHYHGTLASDGTVFDSSYERGAPATFPLSGVIEGWQEGLVGMKVGGTRRLVIPSDKAYGEAGSPPSIGPNADLVFVVELISIQ